MHSEQAGAIGVAFAFYACDRPVMRAGARLIIL